jgi:hypothetical protein
MSDDAALKVVREICAALPETNERLSHGSPTFFIRDKKTFANFHADHHGDGRTAIWFAAPPGVQEQLVDDEPERYFRPPYVGHRGWVGLRVDVDRDDDEIAAVLREAYLYIAPKTLARQLLGE